MLIVECWLCYTCLCHFPIRIGISRFFSSVWCLPPTASPQPESRHKKCRNVVLSNEPSLCVRHEQQVRNNLYIITSGFLLSSLITMAKIAIQTAACTNARKSADESLPGREHRVVGCVYVGWVKNTWLYYSERLRPCCKETNSPAEAALGSFPANNENYALILVIRRGKKGPSCAEVFHRNNTGRKFAKLRLLLAEKWEKIILLMS